MVSALYPIAAPLEAGVCPNCHHRAWDCPSCGALRCQCKNWAGGHRQHYDADGNPYELNRVAASRLADEALTSYGGGGPLR